MHECQTLSRSSIEKPHWPACSDDAAAAGGASFFTYGPGNEDDLSFRLEPLIGEVALKYAHTSADVSGAGLEVEEGTTVYDGERLYLFSA